MLHAIMLANWSGTSRNTGDITCRSLLGLDFSKPGEYQKFLESGVWKDTCERYVQYVIEKLYEFENEKSMDRTGQ